MSFVPVESCSDVDSVASSEYLEHYTDAEIEQEKRRLELKRLRLEVERMELENKKLRLESAKLSKEIVKRNDILRADKVELESRVQALEMALNKTSEKRAEKSVAKLTFGILGRPSTIVESDSETETETEKEFDTETGTKVKPEPTGGIKFGYLGTPHM